MPNVEQIAEELHRFAQCESMSQIMDDVEQGLYPALTQVTETLRPDLDPAAGRLQVVAAVRRCIGDVVDVIDDRFLSVVASHYLDYPGVPDRPVHVRLEAAAAEALVSVADAKSALPRAVAVTALELAQRAERSS